MSEKLKETLGKEETLLISMDDYYKELSEEQSKILYDNEALINFDCPDAINFDLMIEHLEAIINDKEIDLPKFDLGSCVVTNYLKVTPNKYKYIIVEGVFLLCDERVRNLLNLKIWCESSEYICALRRFIKYSRDIQGYTPDFIYNQCIKFVIPGNIRFSKILIQDLTKI